MNFLEERIQRDGIVKEGNVLKVDSFLNHQMDIDLFDKMGEEFKKRFADRDINKILTIEASGIGIACIVAKHFGVPVVFAKKSDTAVNSYHYNDLGLLCLLVSSNSRDELMDYCNSVLGALIQSDKNNKTEYIITAKTYLENNNNLVSTANQLFVHRNTLINRINHIEDLIGRSLKDAETKLELLCAFKLLEFLIE